MLYSHLTGKTYRTERGLKVAETRHLTPKGEFHSTITGKTYKSAHGRNVAEARFGLEFSPEHRKRISEEARRRYADPNHIIFPRSEAHKQAMSKLYKGKPKSDIQKRRMSQAAKGVPKSPDHRASMSEAQTRRYAATRGEQWAIDWYLEQGKEIPYRTARKH